MRAVLLSGLSAVALVAALGLAGAQQASPPAAAQQMEQTASPEQDQAQKKAQETEPGRAGTTEPSSHAQTSESGPPPAFVNGRLAVPGAPADSQTVPAKFSERNARLDELPIMAFPLPLTDEQKQRIKAAVSKTESPVVDLALQPADQVPSSVKLTEIPLSVVKEIPEVSPYHYVRTKEGILLVRAPTMTVVGEIAN